MLILATAKAGEELREWLLPSTLSTRPHHFKRAEMSLSDTNVGRGKSHFMFSIFVLTNVNVAPVEESRWLKPSGNLK